MSGTLVGRYRDYGPSGAAGRDTLRQSLLLSFTGLLTVSDCPAAKLRNQSATCANRQKRRTQLKLMGTRSLTAKGSIGQIERLCKNKQHRYRDCLGV